MSSEEEIHMLPSLVKVYPLTCRPQSGLVLFPSLPGELSRKMEKRNAEACSGVQMEIGVEDYIRDEVLRIIFCSCVTLDFG